MMGMALGHLAWFLACGIGGGQVTRWVLDHLPSDASIRPGTRNAGRYIGYAERSLIYLAMVGQIPWLFPVVMGLKTLVRFPELQARSRQAAEPDGEGDAARSAELPPRPDPSSFAEYYLVGTLVSVTWAVGTGLVAHATLSSSGGLLLALAAGGVAVGQWWMDPVPSNPRP